MLTGSKGLIRDINSTLVLETIINSKSISRAALAKQLGLTKATISAIVQDLMNNNLVAEIGSDDTKFGRKPILLSFNRNAGYVICVDMDVETISALKSDLQGEDRSLKQIKTPLKSELIISAVSRLIETMMQDYHKTPYGLVGIALSIHGSVLENSITYCSINKLSKLNIADELEKLFQTPVFLYNDASLSLLGEKIYNYDSQNIVNLCVTSDVRLGILIHNKLYAGHNGHAGEIGHTIIEAGGRECSCGNRGCLNQYLSEPSLLNELAHKKGLAHIDIETFSSMYQTGDPESIEIMESFIRYLTICVNNILYTYNPEIIIISSHFTSLFPSLTKCIEELLGNKKPEGVTIVPSSLQNSSLLGGISVVIKNFLGINILKL